MNALKQCRASYSNEPSLSEVGVDPLLPEVKQVARMGRPRHAVYYAVQDSVRCRNRVACHLV